MSVLELITELRKNYIHLNLQDGNLKLVGEVKEIPQDLLMRVKEMKEDLRLFLSEKNKTSENNTISKCAIQSNYPLSNAQKRIWVLSQFEGGNKAYNITTQLYLKGKVDVKILELSFQLCIDKHESLRTIFSTENEEPVQIIQDEIIFKIDELDISNKGDLNLELKNEIIAANNIQFDLKEGPLLIVKVIRISTEEFAMIFSMHHIISDGWSIGVMVQEVMNGYKNICLESGAQNKQLEIQYKDFSFWLEARLNGDFGLESKKFWNNKELGTIDSIKLPADFIRPEMNMFEGARQKFYFEYGFYKQIEVLSRNNQTTLFNVFRAVLNICLHKWCSQDSIIIGTPVSGRSHYQLSDQIGLYVNTLPLKSEFDSSKTFKSYLNEVSLDSLDSFNYQDYPFDLIIKQENIKRDSSRNPLFDVLMVVQNTALGDGSIDIKNQHGFTLEDLDTYLHKTNQTEKLNVASKFDMTFSFGAESKKKYLLEIEYRTKLFTKKTIQGSFEMFKYVLNQVIQYDSIKLGDIRITNKIDEKYILENFNTKVNSNKELSIVDLLHRNMSEKGVETAICIGHKTISYTELEKESNSYANAFLESDYSKIGIFLNRSEKTIFAIVGALKAGKTYVPIDTSYPAERIKYIIEDAELDYIITEEECVNKISGINACNIILTTEIASNFTFKLIHQDIRERTAYLIYTSGSTGKPKGVEVSHKNVISFLKWSCKEYAETPFDILYAVTSFCFDLSVFEILFPLVSGKKIRLLDSALDIPSFLKVDQSVFINTVPSVVRNLLEQNMDWKNVVALNMAGEPVPKIFKDEIDYTSIEVRNLYGPSEDTTYSTIYRFIDDQLPYIPIGVPITDTQLYILDQTQNILPIGVEGEIYLSGESLAKGYYNKIELTKEKFVENPFLPGRKMYKTGDLGKWSPDGQVIYLGRKDDQVKIRGYRIELGEIQYQLEAIEEIAQTVVIITEVNGEKNIVAYYQAKNSITREYIQKILLTSLPEYMIPGYFIELDKIPLNNNGKVDKNALPLPIEFLKSSIDVIKATTETEILLLSIWEETLKIKKFGVTHNFFDVGGHSLKATKMKSLIAKNFEKELSLNEIFQNPTIEKQALLIEGKGKTQIKLIKQTDNQEEGLYPLSIAQERLWVLTKFENVSKAYHMPAAFEIKGQLIPELFETAVKKVIERHDSLRTVFIEKEGEPFQKVLSIESYDFILGKHKLKPEEILDEYLFREWGVAFDLEKGPLLKCTIISTKKCDILSFNMHHLISDGWSLGVLFNDVVRAYSNLINEEAITFPPLELQYKDFAVWQRKELTEDVLKSQLSYWRDEVFADGVTPLELPYDNFRPEIKTYKGTSYRTKFTSKLTKEINDQAKEAGASLFMSLMANVNIFLKKISNQDEIIIGTPVSGRDSLQLKDQIGFYVNTLPIKSSVSGNLTFIDFLNTQRESILSAFDYQYFPFELLIEELQLTRDMSRSPLFDVMVVHQNFDILDNSEQKTIELKKLDIGASYTKYDLTFSFSEEQGQIVLELEYNTDLFEKQSIEKLVKQFKQVLNETSKNGKTQIKEISILDEEESRIIEAYSDQAKIGFKKDETIISLFEKVVKRTPASAALCVNGKTFSYEELDCLSGQLAKKLKEDLNVEKEDLIVLHTDRSEWMLISILAVLKSGAAYVPVDPEYPISRIEYIIEDSGSKLLLTDQVLSEGISELTGKIDVLDVRNIDYSGELYTSKIEPNQLAYMIYTSGTTGHPKGVLIEHKNVNRLLFTEKKLFDFDSSDRWSLSHSYCFDFSVWEMYGSLLNGGTLVIVPKEVVQDSNAFYDFLEAEKITVLNQTPTAFKSLSSMNKDKMLEKPLSVRELIFGGEALIPEILKDWHSAYPNCKIVNMYGITETTVHVTYKEITSNEIFENRSNIGTPLPTLSCYVLDKDLRPSPIGVVGELCIGGAGVARGYHNLIELTAEKFVNNPFKPSEKIYLSGDYARITKGGEIEYIGRKDNQVKIRGHRIELAEIESVIKEIDIVKDAVVQAFKDSLDEYELVAYILVEDDVKLPEYNFRTKLLDYLPGYMIPSQFIKLEQFPLTLNGKLDVKGLPSPDAKLIGENEYVAPTNEIELKLVAIWEEVLDKGQIGIKDDFFDLGGHSLKATRVISKIQEEFGVKIDLKNLFINPTIESISEYVDTLKWMDSQNQNLESEQDELIL